MAPAGRMRFDVFPATHEQRCWFSTRSPTSSTRSPSPHSPARRPRWPRSGMPKTATTPRPLPAPSWPSTAPSGPKRSRRSPTTYNYPAEHWVHLRTTNPIESTFASVHLRQRVTKGPDRGRPAWRWRSSSSSPPSNGGVPSTHPTSSLSSGRSPVREGLLVERPDESGGDQQVA
jgi:hypothetical protein